MTSRKVLTLIVRILLVAAPLVWIYSRTDMDAIAGILGSVSWFVLLLILSLTLVNIILQGIKWWVLARRFIPDLKLGKAVAVHMESTFYAIALPTGVAQDVVKSVILSKNHDPSVVWASAWLGRLIGFVILLVYSVAGLSFIEGNILSAGYRGALISVIAAAALLCALSFSKRLTSPILAVMEKVLPRNITRKLEKLRDGIYEFKRAPKTVIAASLISAAVQFLIIFTISLTVFAVSGEFYLLECLAFVPLVEIAVLALPLSPSGVGLREALLAVLFTRMAFDGGQIASYVTLSLMASLVRVAGVVMVIRGRGRQPPSTLTPRSSAGCT